MHVNACGCWIIPILCQWITVPANLCLKPFLIGIDAPIRSLEEVLAKPPQFCCHSMSFLPNSDLSRCFDVWIVSASSSSKRPRMSPASGRVPRPCSLCSTYTWHLASEHEGIGEHDIATVSKNTLQQQRSRQLFMSFSPDVICHEIYVICQNLRCGDVQRMCLCFKGFPLASTGVGGGGHREPQLKTCRRWPLRRQNEYSFPVKHCETMEMTTHWKHTAENKPFTKNATKTCFLSFCLVFGLFDGAHFKTGFLVLCIGLGQVLVHHALSISRLPYRTT